MKTRALAVLLPLLALTGCTEDNGVSIQPYALCAPPEECGAFDGNTCPLVYIGVNALDLAQGSAYWSYIEVHNNTAANSDEAAGRPNTRDAYVEEYSVEYDVDAGVAPTSILRRLPAGPVLVPPDGGTQVVGLYVIPSEVGLQLGGASQVVARVRFRGFLADQSRWESAEFPIPVEICSNCIGYVPCEDPAQTLYVCPEPGQTPYATLCQ